jgi:hypothetical protein
MRKMKPEPRQQQQNGTPPSTSLLENGSRLLNERISRREVLKLAGMGGLGLLLGGGGAYGLIAAKEALAPSRNNPSSSASSETRVPFYGKHQAGIVTPAQNFLLLAAFDLTRSSLSDVRKLFREWTVAAAGMSEGAMIGSHNDNLNLPPSDTGEAAGLSASRLTLTFGVGPSFFDDRFGLSGKRPASFADLPAFRGDALQPEWSGGDLAVQVCADDCRWRSTPSETWHGSPAAPRSCVGCRKVFNVPARRIPPAERPAISWVSRTERGIPISPTSRR